MKKKKIKAKKKELFIDRIIREETKKLKNEVTIKNKE